MPKVRITNPIGEGGRIKFDIPVNCSIETIKILAASGFAAEPESFDLHPQIGNTENVLDYSISPRDLQGAIDEELLKDEYEFLRHQFPLVTMKNLTNYEGMLRCEGGPIKELAEDGVWPFDQYIQWHKFKIKLSYLHPFKPPTVTWLTDIDHPNIIPYRNGKVCVSLLGKGWLPQTKLAAIINALYFLLYDPNPYSHYPNKRCKRAADMCKKYGFPRRRGGILARHNNAITCPNCRRPFILEDPDSRVIQCIHCKVILRRGIADEEDMIQ